MKKRVTEKNLNLDEWTEAIPAEIEIVKTRNALMKEKKDAKFTARLSASDFKALREAAEREGMGYQTLLGSIVHKYVNKRLVDIEEVRKVIDLKKVTR